MTIRQRALLQTFFTVLGICAIGVVGGFISTFMTPLMFYVLLAAIMFGFFCYLIYSWNVSALEMQERFAKYREEK